jgi:rare lipoprotein A
LSGAAANAASSASVGAWATITKPAPSKPSKSTFDHWQAKITLAKPVLKRTTNVSLSIEPPYALHGPITEGTGRLMNGIASFYGSGERTATGEAFDPNGLTAAHRTLPFGTRVRVTRVDNGESVIVRINDRGPFKPGRVIDLSRRAAEDLRMTDTGLTAVKLEVVDRGDDQPGIIANVAQRSVGR